MGESPRIKPAAPVLPPLPTSKHSLMRSLLPNESETETVPNDTRMSFDKPHASSCNFRFARKKRTSSAALATPSAESAPLQPSTSFASITANTPSSP